MWFRKNYYILARAAVHPSSKFNHLCQISKSNWFNYLGLAQHIYKHPCIHKVLAHTHTHKNTHSPYRSCRLPSPLVAEPSPLFACFSGHRRFRPPLPIIPWHHLLGYHEGCVACNGWPAGRADQAHWLQRRGCYFCSFRLLLLCYTMSSGLNRSRAVYNFHDVHGGLCPHPDRLLIN
jgi:hypothetical protein